MKKYPFTLKELPFEYQDLEPVISQTILEFHNDKHLSGYIKNLNATLEKTPELHNVTLTEILKDFSQIPKELLGSVTNNGGGVFNHNFYFESLTEPNTTELSGEFKEKIIKDFGSVDEFKKKFKHTANNIFGSGWGWLVLKNEKLSILKTHNQDTPLKDGYIPLLAIDVWEHAYYLDYQNLRKDYVEKFMSIINWDKVAERYYCS